jgi:hypothetical protein
LSIQQGLIDDAMSFASEFGGSFASIQALQQMDVGLARQQLDIATEFRDRVAAGLVAGASLFEAQADVARQTLNVRRKELGVQKDLMSRLLGGVFGELNANIGARRGVGSDVALMGMDKTRMKNAAGMFVDVPGGKPGTIAERALKRQMGGGAGGPLAELEKAGGPMAEIAKALGKAPTKDQQDKLFGSMTGTEKNTKDSANSLGLGDHPGSFFTHDTTAEGLLGGILGVLREMAIKTLEEDQIKTPKGETGREDVTTKLDKIIAESSKVATVNAENISREKAGLVTDVVQKAPESAGKLKMEVAASTKASTENKANKAYAEAYQKYGADAKETEDARKAFEQVSSGVGTKASAKALTPDEANKAYAEAYQKYGADAKETEDARKAFEQASSTPMTVKGGTKADDTNKFWVQKKPTAIGGAKIGGAKETDGLGGTDPRWANRIKIGESPAKLKRMERLEMSSGLAERHKAAFGGTKTAGGVQTIGGFGGKGVGGVSSTTSGSDTMTGRAAGMSVAPPMSGNAVAKAPGGAGAETGETGSGMKVTGEMLVRFDNKMFKDTLTPVVLQIMDTNKRRWQQMFMTGAGA